MNTINTPSPFKFDFTGKQKQKFSLDAKMFFLTYPRNSTTKEDAMNTLKKLFIDNLEYAIVCSEDHKEDAADTTIKHLHILFKTINRYKTTKGDCFDIIADKHGYYQQVRSETGAIKKKHPPMDLELRGTRRRPNEYGGVRGVRGGGGGVASMLLLLLLLLLLLGFGYNSSISGSFGCHPYHINLVLIQN
jgi:hypothetical protein